jgi:purine operon repressor
MVYSSGTFGYLEDSMKKLKRSARIVDMTRKLIENPRKIISLSQFAEEYSAAKSSISEDLAIIKEVFEDEGIGILRTISGAAGGAVYIPYIDPEQAKQHVIQMIEQLSDPSRILSGGYLYMSDLLGDPQKLSIIGKIFASYFCDKEIEYVITVETKGIPLAYACANHLQVPVIIVRRDSRVTEGSVVTINYVSGSSKRIQTMSLGRRAMPMGAKVLIIDDFMKAGGTVRGMMDLLAEFEAHVVGTCVLVEAASEERLVDQYLSLARLTLVDPKEKKVQLDLGNYFE